MLRRYTRETQEYREEKKIAKKVCTNKKRKATKEKLEDINKHYVRHNSREFYRKIRQKGESYQHRLHNIMSKSGEILIRWTDYFRNVFNKKRHEEEQQPQQGRLLT